MIRNQFFLINIFLLIAGCGMPQANTSAGHDFPPSGLYGIISNNDKEYFDVSDKKFSPKPEYTEFFDEIELPVSNKAALKDKQITFYYQTTSNSEKLKLSVPITWFKSGYQLCLPIAQQEEFCTANAISVDNIVGSKQSPLTFQRFSAQAALVQYPKRENNLIVIAPTVIFERNGASVIIQNALKNFFAKYKKLGREAQYASPEFSLMKISSGRAISKEILTKEKLLSNSFNDQKLALLISKLEFNVFDWRPIRDLSLVESQIEDNSAINAILYITGNDGFAALDKRIPRNQCIPLAWQRDQIRFWVITNEDCAVWQEQFAVPRCLELESFKADKEAVFKGSDKATALTEVEKFITEFFSFAGENQ